MNNSVEILKHVEDKFNLFDFTIRGFKVWWICRQKVFRMIEASNQPIRQCNTNISKKVKISISYLKYIRSLNVVKSNYKPTDIVCISGTNMRREVVDGKEFDIIFDYIGKYDTNTSYAVLNTLSGKGYIKNSYTKQCYNMTNMSFEINFWRKLYKVVLTKDEIDNITYIFNQVNEYIKNKFDLQVNVCNTVLENTSALVKVYSKGKYILEKINPKVIYVECAYSPTHMIFIYAAKALGIKVVEFQHGLISSKHPGYTFNKKLTGDEPIPDIICVFGSYFKDMLQNMNPITELNIMEYGYQYLNEQVVNILKNKEEPKEYDILITTQGNYGGLPEQWNSFIKEYLKLDKKRKILLKLHPNEVTFYKELYKDIIDNPRIHVAKGKNLYECFRISKTHISCYSTCHIEALACNIETSVIKLNGWQHVDYLKDYGVEFIGSPKELKEILDSKKETINFNDFKMKFFNIYGNNLEEKDIEKRIVDINNFFLNN